MIQSRKFVVEIFVGLAKAYVTVGLEGSKEFVNNTVKHTMKGVKLNTPLLAKNAAVCYVNKKLKEHNNKVNNRLNELS